MMGKESKSQEKIASSKINSLVKDPNSDPEQSLLKLTNDTDNKMIDTIRRFRIPKISR